MKKKAARILGWLKSDDKALEWTLRYGLQSAGCCSYNISDFGDKDEFIQHYRELASAYSAIAREVYAAGKAVVYRAIEVPYKTEEDLLTAIDFKCIGRSWAWLQEGAEVYGLVPTSSRGQTVTMTGEVSPESIDWQTGFEMFLIRSGEWEIALKKHQPVLVTHLNGRKLRKPIKANTGTSDEDWEESCREVRRNPAARRRHPTKVVSWRLSHARTRKGVSGHRWAHDDRRTPPTRGDGQEQGPQGAGLGPVAAQGRAVIRRNPIAPRTTTETLFRSVSPGEYADFLARGRLVGRGGWFSGDERGKVWFGRVLQEVKHSGEDVSRYVVSLPEFMEESARINSLHQEYVELRKQVNSLSGEDDLYWRVPPALRRRMLQAEDRYYREHQKNLDHMTRVEAKVRRQNLRDGATSFVLEFQGLSGGTAYTGKDSFHGSLHSEKAAEIGFEPGEVTFDNLARVHVVLNSRVIRVMTPDEALASGPTPMKKAPRRSR